jgi:predicted Zn-dependent protease
MRIRINLRFAIYLTLTAAALATGAHFLHAYQVSRNADSLRSRAQQYREQGDLSKAADCLNHYLGLNPKNDEVQAEYGLLLADDQVSKTPQDKYRALLTLEKVLVRKPDRQDVRRRAAQVAMAIGYYASARDNLLYPLKDFPKQKSYLPKDPEVALMLAQCLDALSDYKNARLAYEHAITVAPRDLDAYARLAALLLLRTEDVLTSQETAEKNAKLRANKVIEEMVEANKGSYRAYLLHAQYVRKFPDPAGPDAADSAKKQKESADKIATDLAQAETLAPNEADVLLALAEQAAKIQDQIPLARTRLQRCCELHPKDWRSYQVLAQIDVKEGKIDQAIANLDRGLAQVPKSVELNFERAKLLADAGRGSEAKQSIEALKEGLPAPDLAVLNGRLEMRAENWIEAIKKLEEAYEGLITRADRLRDDSAVHWAEQAGLWLGECYQQVGDVGRAQSVYSRVVARNPKSIEGRFGVATTSWEQGRLQEALDQYRVVVRLSERLIPGWLGVARLAMLVNLQERDPSNRNWDEVQTALNQANELAKGLKPKPIALAILDADYLANLGKIADARKSLEGSYPDQASRPAEVWVALAAMDDLQGQTAEALACLDDAQRLGGDRVELRLARANHLVRHGEGKANDALRALANDVDRFTDVDRRHLLRGLAIAYTQAKMTAEAGNLWQRLARELPKDLQSRLALFDLAASGRDEAAINEMDRWQKEIQVIEGDDGVIWRQARISVLLADAQKGSDLSGLSTAKKLLAQIAARQPDSPRVPLNGARIADVEGRPDDAVPLFLRAIFQLGERDPGALARTYNLLVERGRLEEANRVAQLLPNPSSSDQAGLQAIGEVALRSNDLKRAKDIAEEAVKVAPDDYRSYLLRGQTRWKGARAEKEFNDAEEDFQKARDLAPSEPATWLTQVQFLVAAKGKKDALATADAAQGVLTGPKGLLALARINILVGRADRAADLFRAAVAAAGDDAEVLGSAAIYYLNSGRQKEADDLLQRLSKSPDRKSAAQASFLQRALLLGRNGPDALVEANKLMKSPGGNEAGLTLAEKIQQQRSNAQLLALQPFRDRRQRAVKLLENLIDNQLANPADHLLTAQLYEWLGDVAKARARYTALLTLPGVNNPDIFVAAGQFLIRHGDLDGAALALRGLDQQPRQAAAANILRARLLHAQNQTDKAVALLKDSAEKGGTDRSVVAGVLEEIGAFDEAETQLGKYVAASPDGVLTHAKFLVRRGRFDEALNVCDGAWSHCPPVAVADTCLAALSQIVPPDLSAVERVAKRIEAALAKSPDDTSLLAAVAVVRNFQGRFDDSVALYRRILMKDPGHRMALNNLAWLLAFKGGHADEAVVLIDRAIQASGIDPNLLDTRAVAFLAMNKAEPAVVDLEQVIAASPSPTAYFHLAQAQLQAGRKDKALQAWRKAKEGGRLPQNLHPLERPAFDRLVGLLDPAT